ncbi:hypothetical protein [Laceyella putida]|uniref:Uncharacterized protein n=1 Tax=Laceyella putida TaxID=110101 RepID=A0ABW2RHX0_9BACL
MQFNDKPNDQSNRSADCRLERGVVDVAVFAPFERNKAERPSEAGASRSIPFVIGYLATHGMRNSSKKRDVLG